MTPTVVALYVVPPVLAILLSALCKSRSARSLLLAFGFASLLAFAPVFTASLDCAIYDFAFTDCSHLPEPIAGAISWLQALFALSYLFAGPILIVVAALLEMVARVRA